MYSKKYIYSIALSQNKYYISSCNDLHYTFKYLFSGKSKNKWLSLYKPIYVHKIMLNETDDKEHELLKSYICRYGIDNVHGSTFDSFTIEEIAFIEAVSKLD